MKGYVMNTTPVWAHAMKRAVGPGAKISLSELYEQYGVKYDIAEGKEFADWLRNVKLKDTNKWKIIFEEDNTEPKNTEVPITVNKAPNNDNVAPIVKVKPEIADIVNLSVRQARERLPKITDLKLLKFALKEANQLAGKDSLCKVIRKRIKDLQIGR